MGLAVLRILASVLASTMFVVVRGQAQTPMAADDLLRRLEDARASVREKATRELASRAAPEELVRLLDAAATMRAETMRRVAVALGRNRNLLGALARRLETADAGAGLAARAIHEHFLAHVVPLPEDPDRVALLPADAISLRGIADLESLIDATLVDALLPVPIILDPSLALDGSPAKESWAGREGAVPLRHLLPRLGSDASLEPLRTTMRPRAILVHDRPGVRSLPALFVRSLAFFVSSRAPLALRRRAAIALGNLDVPTVDAWLRLEARDPGEIGDAAVLALAVRVLRGSTSRFVDPEIAERAVALGRARDPDRWLIGSALRIELGRAFAKGLQPDWFRHPTSNAKAPAIAMTDPFLAALLAGVPTPMSWREDLEACLRRADVSDAVVVGLAHSAAHESAGIDDDLVRVLVERATSATASPQLVEACLRLLDARAPQWWVGGGGSGTAREPNAPGRSIELPALWAKRAELGAVWGASLQRRAIPRLGLDILGTLDSLEEFGPGAFALVREAFGGELPWALFQERLATWELDRAALLVGEIRLADSGAPDDWVRLFAHLRSRIPSIGSAGEARAIGRAYARCLLAFSTPHEGKRASTWLVDLLRGPQPLLVFESAYRSVLRARPLMARDVLFELPRRTDLGRDVRLKIPALLERVTRERTRGRVLVDPWDPLRR